MAPIEFFPSPLYANTYEFDLYNAQIQKLIINSNSLEKTEQILYPKRTDTTEIHFSRSFQTFSKIRKKSILGGFWTKIDIRAL